MPPDPLYLTIGEVADRLRTSRQAIYQQHYRRQAPGCLGVKVGRRILWRVADLESWFDEKAAEAAAEIRP
ncbi:MAG: helix-turn-helix transcriptional regulator [Acidimicrobiia bacterium]